MFDTSWTVCDIYNLLLSPNNFFDFDALISIAYSKNNLFQFPLNFFIESSGKLKKKVYVTNYI